MRMRSGNERKKHKRIIPFSNSILVRSGNNIVKEYNFDHLIDHKTSQKEIFSQVLLSLLECVFYDHKDATLIAYGHRNTGETLFFIIFNRENFHSRYL